MARAIASTTTSELNAVRSLIEEGHINIVYQPVWDVGWENVIAYEALARMPDYPEIDGPQEAEKVLVTMHASDSGYSRQVGEWDGASEYKPFQPSPLRSYWTVAHQPMADAVAALVSHGALSRFPNLRVMSVENGSDWVERLLELKSLGVDQFAIYLQHDSKELTLQSYAEHVMPAFPTA